MAAISAETTRGDVRPAGDYLMTGVMAMLVINVVQRVVGFLRGVGFCHFLSEEQLGSWALANSFFAIGIPIALLGLPGSFSKFVEHYRKKSQLGDYLTRVLTVSSLGVTIVVAWLVFFPSSFSWLVFGTSLPYYCVLWCVVAFLALIVFSVVHEIVASLRHVKTIAIMQFVQSIVFAVVGLALIAASNSWTVLLPSFAIASAAGAIPGVLLIRESYKPELRRTGALDTPAMWQRVLPFAVGLWILNLLSNLFEMGDRYMLLHLSEGGYAAGQAAVGQYHCGRIVPNLLVSFSMMLGGILLPFFAADWESGNKSRIAARVRQATQIVCVGSIAVSTVAMLAAPLLFHFALENRYAAAEAILPLALLHGIWVSLFLVAESYMLCAERSRELIAILILGLLVNFSLNAAFIGPFGLSGAVAATSIACLLSLMLLLWRIAKHGGWFGTGTIVLCFAPVVVLAGSSAAMVLLFFVTLVAGRSDWLLTANDRQQLDEALLPKLRRIGLNLPTLWPR